MTERPDLPARSTPRPAPAADADPIDAARPTRGAPGHGFGRLHKPPDSIPRQFRFSNEDDDLLLELHEYLGDKSLVESVRRFLRACAPLVMSGQIKVPED